MGVWLKFREYSNGLLRGQILKAKKCLRLEVLNKQKHIENKIRFVFNIIRCFWNAEIHLLNSLKQSKIHPLLKTNRKHGSVFEKFPVIGFRKAKNFKNILVRAKLAPLEKKKGYCRSCGDTRCKICKNVVTTEHLGSFSTDRIYCIQPNNLNCRSCNDVYLFSLKPCSNQYTGSTESFRPRFDNYKSAAGVSLKENCQISVISRSFWGWHTSWYE